MKYLLAFGSVLLLTGCFGGGGQTLPPELLGGPAGVDIPAVGADPLAGLPPVQNPLTTVETPAEPSDSDLVEDPATEVEPTGPNCEAIVADLETSFTDINYCNIDADCAVAEGSCPFGCYIFHNAGLDFADYQPTLDTYRASCNPCEYKCATKPRVNNIRCREGRCVDTRYDS